MPSSNTTLHEAVMEGDSKIVNQLLESQIKVNERDSEGRTPLHIAIKANRPDLVKLLLEHGANPNMGYKKRVRHDVNQIVDHKPLYLTITNLKYTAPQEELRNNEEIASLLMLYGAHIHDKHHHFGLDWDAEENTLLHVAVHRMRPDLIALLLSAGANVNALNAKRRPPLYAAFLVRTLEESGDHDEIVNHVLSLQSENSIPPVLGSSEKEAAYRALGTAVSQLLQAGARTQFQIHFGRNYSNEMFNLSNGTDDIENHARHIKGLFFKAIEEGNEEKATYFIKLYPGLMNEKNEQSKTPINFALEKKQDLVAKLLLEKLEIKLNREIATLSIYGEKLNRKGQNGEKFIQLANTLKDEAQIFFKDTPFTEEKCQSFQKKFLNILQEKSQKLPKPTASMANILKRIAFVVISIILPVIPIGLYVYGKITNNPHIFSLMKDKDKTKEKTEDIEATVNSISNKPI